MLEGLAMQKTTFPVEFLVHDDASTDGTAAIVREFAERDPERFIPMLEEENQYSKGNSFLFTKILPAARGKYIAFCEGDDYWTDPEKLQRQFDALESHPECSMCVHRVQGMSEDGSKKIRTFPRSSMETGPVNSKEFVHRMLSRHEWLFHTTSYFLKKEILFQAVQDHYGFFLNAMYPDHGMMLLGVYTGGLYYLDRCMSVYRMEAKGGVTNKCIPRDQDVARRKSRSERGIRSLEDFDRATEYRYHEDVKVFLDYSRYLIADCEKDYKYLLRKDKRAHFKVLPPRMKLRVVISRYIPVFDRIYFWLRKLIKGA